MAINETINITNQSLLNQNPLITNIVLAMIIFFIGLIVGRILSRLIERIFKNFGVDNTVRQTTGLKMSFQKFLSNLVSYASYIIFFIIALNQVGITHLLLNIVIIVIVLVILTTIIFSLKDKIPNMIAYRTLRKQKALKIGDEIMFKTAKGKILEINVYETIIQTDKKDLLHIPNILFIKESFVQKKINKHRKNKKLHQFTKKD
ncbi:MAG: mechanosensitive ion channel [Patescibacteria group bacterium]|nr:mechanosensitive ion channel [Patescibacteria group bacterium]